ncbi:MAG: carboxypeptidase-like regulatory domain-containing protein [Flavobacteriaceae bacterium]
MKKISNLWLVVMLLASATIFAQISGTVADEAGPLADVNVTVKGTSMGTTTDFDGNFTIEKAKTGTLVLSYVGYEPIEISFSTGDNLGTVLMSDNGESLSEIVLTATSFAVDRKTPVAVSTIKAAVIEEKLGTQEFPEILKSTPGVYATKTGGGYGDGRINLRGFGSQNIGVLINGVPVNDMENGAVYWSNWAGLGDVTSAMQVQRGLGASKVAVPSVGGTINIITKSTDATKGGNVKMGVANDGYLKFGVTLSTGKMDNGFAATVSAAKITGDGYVDGTNFDGFNYFVNLAKQINDDHKLSFTAFGAKQTHGQRYNRRTIAGYKATESGPKRFNPDWGYRNGQVEHSSYNFYHKPQISLNHNWTISDNTFLTTAVYASFGEGGGRRPQGSKLTDDTYRLGSNDQPINYDRIVAENKANGSFGSSDIFAASRNAHKWYGLLSTMKTNVNDKLAISGGLDTRYYVGSHWYEVTDLLGGQYYLNTRSSDNTFNQALKVGDRFNKDYDGKVVKAGLFAQAEYSPQDNISIFVSTAATSTTYSKEDFMKYASTDDQRLSEDANFIGYSVKGGANYNLNDESNVFANVGYFSKAPFLTGNVFLSKSSTELNEDALNEKVFSAELGYGYKSPKLSGHLNVYRTSWIDKSLTGSEPNPDDQTTRIEYNIPGLDALHQGVELDLVYRATDKLKFKGMASLGDWKWKNDTSGDVFAEDGTLLRTVNVYAKDLKVSDAAQTTFALGLDYDLLEKSSIYIDYNYASDLFASYRITGSTDSSNRANSWELPAYGLFDLGLKHGFDVGGLDAKVIGRINNVFNTEYVSDARGSQGGDHTGATVYYGAGRTFSVGFKVKF